MELCHGPCRRSTELQVKCPVSAEGTPQMDQSPLGKATGLQTLECLLLLLYLYMVAAALFLWYLAWCEWMWGDPIACNAVCLSLGNILFY